MSENPILEGALTGIGGIAVGYLIEALEQALSVIGPPWYIWAFWIAVLIIDFAMGLAEVINGGCFLHLA
ncbi:MAG: hypothetical protein QXS54_02645 [Candidatus Methanomethylicaceae archaeon]